MSGSEGSASSCPASADDHAPHSPSSFPLINHGGAFSEDDIQQLLGAMHDHHQDDERVAEPAADVLQDPGSFSPDEGLPSSSSDAPRVSMGLLDNHPHHNDVSEDMSVEARAQRKRSREKQRRSDTNKHFTDLSVLLQQIETEDLEGQAPYCAVSGGSMNRVDLIARTIGVLERMRQVNKKRKVEIVDLKKQVQDANQVAEHTAARLKEATLYQQGPPKPVMMMMPMMVTPDMVAAGATPGTGTPFPMVAPSPFMSQPFIPQPTLGTAAPTGTTAAPTTDQTTTATPTPVTAPTMMAIPPMMFNAAMQQRQMTMMVPQPNGTTVASTTAQGTSPKQHPINGGGNLAHCA